MKNKFQDSEDELDWSLSEEELTNTLVSHQSSPLLFGVVEPEQVLLELAELGSLEKIKARGYVDFRADKTTHVQHDDRFTLWGRHESDQKEYLLFDIRTRSSEIEWTDGSKVRALFWEWLGFQDPKAEFTEDRPPLPGQEFPGLGVFRSCTKILRRHVGETSADVIVSIPEYFHNAWLYTHFRFLNPEKQGEFKALCRDIMPLGLSGASHAVHGFRVLNQLKEVFEWKPYYQVFPLNNKTSAHFLTDEYQRTVAAFEKSCSFEVLPTSISDELSD